MIRYTSLALLPLALAGCGESAQNNGEAAQGNAAASTGQPFTVTPITGFNQPWAMTFLPDGRMLVTEKEGTMQLVAADGQSRKAVSGIPKVDPTDQGGLMDVVLHPQFAQNRLVYFSFAEAGDGDTRGVALARGTLADGDAPALQNVQVLLRGDKVGETGGHFSGRIAFATDGHLFFTAGERQKFDPAQDKKMLLGKVLRLNDDGTPAKDNPLVAEGFRPEVWSYGHRNLLGLAFAPDGNLWEQEMGPQGGDEVNLILPGRNYGYPLVSNGDHYDDRPIPDHKEGDGFEAPKVWWNPSISPGGLIVYTGDLFPEWKGDVFIGGLSSMSINRIDVDGTNATKGDQWEMGQRIREVEQGPDGAIYVLEDGPEGRLLKLTPPA